MPTGWPLWIDDDLAIAPATADRTWRPSRRVYVPGGVVLVFAALGLLAGASAALILGRIAALLAGMVGFIRPRWIGAPTRIATGITAGAGVVLIVAGARLALITPKPGPGPTTSPTASTTDPRFPTCKAANAAGYGNYRRGRDREYDWYRDNDDDGTACEH